MILCNICNFVTGAHCLTVTWPLTLCDESKASSTSRAAPPIDSYLSALCWDLPRVWTGGQKPGGALRGRSQHLDAGHRFKTSSWCTFTRWTEPGGGSRRRSHEADPPRREDGGGAGRRRQSPGEGFHGGLLSRRRGRDARPSSQSAVQQREILPPLASDVTITRKSHGIFSSDLFNKLVHKLSHIKDLLFTYKVDRDSKTNQKALTVVG